MRRLSSRSARLLACLLIAGLLYSLALTLVHSHDGGNYRPDCPACHQERAIGSSSGPVAVAIPVPSPIDLGGVNDFEPQGARSILGLRQSAPRSPPSPA